MKRVKSVAFNIADPYELALYEHCKKHKYFSTYIKRLVARDMEGGEKIDLTKFEEASKIFKDIDLKGHS
jgi:hypothetical protein